MKYFLVFALALPLIFTVQAKVCPKECPAYRDPVCATNGDCVKVFDNECMLMMANCFGDLDLLLVCMVQAKSCASQCPENYDPVCVSYGDCLRMFDNACLRDCAGTFQFKQVPLNECKLDNLCLFYFGVDPDED